MKQQNYYLDLPAFLACVESKTGELSPEELDHATTAHAWSSSVGSALMVAVSILSERRKAKGY